MNIQIKNRYNSNIIWDGEATNIKDAVQQAVKAAANLSWADLSGAFMPMANLYKANLSGANLSGADLYGANLYGANLYGADLSRANLSWANLSDANLSKANLIGARNIELVIAKTRILPEGDLIGWKKCQQGVIVKLLIPSDAKRNNAFGRKCRAEFVKVLEIIGAEVGYTDAILVGGTIAEYRTDEIVRPDSWDEDFKNECSHGIHFYITREEAEAN